MQHPLLPYMSFLFGLQVDGIVMVMAMAWKGDQQWKQEKEVKWQKNVAAAAAISIIFASRFAYFSNWKPNSIISFRNSTALTPRQSQMPNGNCSWQRLGPFITPIATPPAAAAAAAPVPPSHFGSWYYWAWSSGLWVICCLPKSEFCLLCVNLLTPRSCCCCCSCCCCSCNCNFCCCCCRWCCGNNFQLSTKCFNAPIRFANIKCLGGDCNTHGWKNSKRDFAFY